jgi:hypothetical protein
MGLMIAAYIVLRCMEILCGDGGWFAKDAEAAVSGRVTFLSLLAVAVMIFTAICAWEIANASAEVGGLLPG